MLETCTLIPDPAYAATMAWMFKAAIAITIVQAIGIPWLTFRAATKADARFQGLDAECRRLTGALETIAGPQAGPRRVESGEHLRAIARQALKAGNQANG